MAKRETPRSEELPESGSQTGKKLYGEPQSLGLDPNAPDAKDSGRGKGTRKRRSKEEIAADRLAADRVLRQERREKAAPLVASLIGQYETGLSLIARAPVEFTESEHGAIGDAALTLCELYLDTERFERILPWIVISSLSLGAVARARQEKAKEETARAVQFQGEMGGADGS